MRLHSLLVALLRVYLEIIRSLKIQAGQLRDMPGQIRSSILPSPTIPNRFLKVRKRCLQLVHAQVLHTMLP